MDDPLNPGAALLAKIGSILVHVDEATGEGAHHLDWQAVKGLMDDPEVTSGLEGMDALALLPKKRR